MKISTILDTMEQLFRMERQIPAKQAIIELALQELKDCKGYKQTIGRQRVAAAEAEANAHQAQMDELAATIPADSSLLLLCEFVAENRLKREDLVAAVTKAATRTEVAEIVKTSWRERASGAPSQQAVEAKQALEKATQALIDFEERVRPIETFIREEQEREQERAEFDAWIDRGMEGKPALVKRTEAKWMTSCLEGCESRPIRKLQVQFSL